MATQAANSISTARAGTPFSVRRINGNGAGVFEILGAPDRGRSHHLKSMQIVGGSADDGFNILRRACLKLGAAAQNITITDAAGVQMGTGDFSLELWFRWVSGTVAAVPALVSKLSGTEGFLLELTAAGLPKFTLGDADESIAVTGTKKVVDGIWHHIAVTVDRTAGPSNAIVLYIDGVSNASTTDLTIEGTSAAAAANITMTGVNSVSFALAGVGLYKALALAAATVLARFAPLRLNQVPGGSGVTHGSGVKFTGDETSLAVGLNLDEGAGTTLYDATGVHTVAGTGNTWDETDGLPLGQNALTPTIKFPAVGTVLDVGFDPPLEIGKGNPLRTLETDGSFEVQFNGETR